MVELTRTQQTVARRMAESKATIPDFTLQIDVDMEECVRAARGAQAARADELRRRGRSRPTYNDMVVKACAPGAARAPAGQRQLPRRDASQLHSRVNVGVAVAASDALVVPTVFDADEKSLGEIARETRALAERVRDGHDHPARARRRHVHRLEPRHVRRPQLHRDHQPAAGGDPVRRRARAPRAVADGGELRPATMLTLTLVCDHRILYGADAAQFLARIRELLQAPASLTL